MNSNEDLVNYLIKTKVLKSEKFIKAFSEVDRKDFMWPGFESYAYTDSPAPLGETGQTISAPHMNAYAMEILEIDENDVILEVGAGSGYQAALIGMVIKLYRGAGHIYSIEYLEPLYRFASLNIEKYGLEDYVTIIYGDGSLGWPPRIDKPIYDKILVSAAASKPPKYLLAQLKDGGKMLIPLGKHFLQKLFLFTKREGEIYSKELFSVAFVPLKEAEDND